MRSRLSVKGTVSLTVWYRCLVCSRWFREVRKFVDHKRKCGIVPVLPEVLVPVVPALPEVPGAIVPALPEVSVLIVPALPEVPVPILPAHPEPSVPVPVVPVISDPPVPDVPLPPPPASPVPVRSLRSGCHEISTTSRRKKKRNQKISSNKEALVPGTKTKVTRVASVRGNKRKNT